MLANLTHMLYTSLYSSQPSLQLCTERLQHDQMCLGALILCWTIIYCDVVPAACGSALGRVWAGGQLRLPAGSRGRGGHAQHPGRHQPVVRQHALQQLVILPAARKML